LEEVCYQVGQVSYINCAVSVDIAADAVVVAAGQDNRVAWLRAGTSDEDRVCDSQTRVFGSFEGDSVACRVTADAISDTVFQIAEVQEPDAVCVGGRGEGVGRDACVVCDGD